MYYIWWGYRLYCEHPPHSDTLAMHYGQADTSSMRDIHGGTDKNKSESWCF